MESWPSVSIVIPTLNSQRTLEFCLRSVRNQKYPRSLEIIVADGGSTDKTIAIAKKYNVKVIHNRLMTAEAGKAVGYKGCRGEIVGFIDSDNVLPVSDWLSKVVSPFIKDNNILATEPVRFSYRRKDHWLTRYFALLGMGDPVNLFIGWYDKYSFITNKWTGMKIPTSNNKGYFSFYLKKDVPTIGANGFFIRRRELLKYGVKDYLFDIDVLKTLAKREKIKVAKVDIGIVHLFSGDLSTFVRKQKRRIKDYMFFSKQGLRMKDSANFKLCWGIVKFVVLTILVFPLFIQALIGYFRKNDPVWLFHPVACWLTLLVYVGETIKFPIFGGLYNRQGWKQ